MNEVAIRCLELLSEYLEEEAAIVQTRMAMWRDGDGLSLPELMQQHGFCIACAALLTNMNTVLSVMGDQALPLIEGYLANTRAERHERLRQVRSEAQRRAVDQLDT